MFIARIRVVKADTEVVSTCNGSEIHSITTNISADASSGLWCKIENLQSKN